jgi:hypothetical protein
LERIEIALRSEGGRETFRGYSICVVIFFSKIELKIFLVLSKKRFKNKDI